MEENKKDWGEYRRNYNKEKYERIYLYLTSDEKKQWQETADRRGSKNLSDYIKQTVRKDINSV